MVPFIPRLARLHFRHAPSSRNEMRGGSRPSQGRGGRAVPCAKVAGARGLAPRARAPSVDGAARTSTTTGFPREANSELHRWRDWFNYLNSSWRSQIRGRKVTSSKEITFLPSPEHCESCHQRSATWEIMRLVWKFWSLDWQRLAHAKKEMRWPMR